MFSVENIRVIKSNLVGSEGATKWLAKESKAEPVFIDSSREFLFNHKLDQQFVDILNTFEGDMLEQTAVSKLSYKIPAYHEITNKYNKFMIEQSKLIVAKTLLDNLMAIGVIKYNSELVQEVTASGAVKLVTKTKLFFKEGTLKSLLHGAHSVPGMVLSKVVHTKPGAKVIKLNAEQKQFLGDIASMKFRLVKTSPDWFRQYYKQSPWYTEALKSGSEDRILLDLRVEKYIKAIQALQAQDVVYLSAWFDSRYRLYYDFNLIGVNPHGKLGETSQWELAEPRKITQNGFEALVDSVVKIATGKRVKHSDAMQMYTDNYGEYMTKLVDASLWDMDDLFYNTRLVNAINDFYQGKESYFIVAEDCTTGGLQHGGIGFKSIKSMEASNVGGNEQPHDAHSAMQMEFKLHSRNAAKDINTPLLHGSTLKTISDVLYTNTNVRHDIRDIEEHLIHVYGKEVLNIPKIATWGTLAVTNNEPSLVFRTIDGWLAQSTSYMESVPLTIYALSMHNKTGYSKSSITRDMPLLLNAKGQPVYGAENKAPGSKHGVRVKNRGLYANITHAIDGKALRDIARMAIHKGEAILFKHDDFICTPDLMIDVRDTYKESLIEEFEYSAYATAMEDIVTHSKSAIKPVQLDMGDATVEMIKNSQGFLSA